MCSSETSAPMNQATRRCISEDSNLNLYNCESLKSDKGGLLIKRMLTFVPKMDRIALNSKLICRQKRLQETVTVPEHESGFGSFVLGNGKLYVNCRKQL
jgi:hypothetical protein